MVQAFSKEQQLGKSPWRRTITRTGKWQRLKKKFKAGKDDFQGYYPCNQCGKSFKEIEVDHIIKRSVDPSRIYDETNLQLLCHDCHWIKDNT